MRNRLVRTLLAGGTMLAFPVLAHAQQAAPANAAASAELRDFDLPAEPLSRAAVNFSQQAGIQLVLGTPVGDGVRSVAIKGRYSIADALGQLLAGTGLSWRWLNAGTITIEPSAAGSGARTLGAVRVEGVQTMDANGFAKLGGFGSGAGANGSSDSAATEGTGSFATNGTSVTSKIPTPAQQTTQSVSTLTQARIEQQNLNDLSTSLSALPGLTFQDNGSAGVILSRGFAVSNFSIDNGAPQSLAVFGGRNLPFSRDLSEYDNVQVLRGSSALFGGAGDPGGIVSLTRKRPLDHQQLVVDLQAGSYNDFRGEVDATSPLAFDGHLRARIVGVLQSHDYFYDYSHRTKQRMYGVLEQDLGAKTILRVGGSYEHNRQRAPFSQGLPRYLDGTDPRFDRSTCLCAPDARRVQNDYAAFAQLDHEFAKDWSLRINTEWNRTDSAEQDAQYTGNLTQENPTLYYNGLTTARLKQDSKTVNGYLTGAFDVFGRKQSFVVGADWTDQNISSLTGSRSISDNPIFDPFNFDPRSFSGGTAGELDTFDIRGRLRQWGGYVRLALNPLRPLHLSGGVRLSNYTTISGPSLLAFGDFQVPFAQKTQHENGVISPSVEGSLDIVKNVSIYASYNSTFRQQLNALDAQGQNLPPTRGKTYETGIKSSLRDSKVQLSLSYYNSSNTNLALSSFDTSGNSFFVNGGTLRTRGVDFEVTGELTPRWQIQFGYSFNKNKFNQAYYDALKAPGSPPIANSQQPEHQVKLWTAYTLSGALKDLTLGGGLRLESERFTEGTVCAQRADPLTGQCPNFETIYFSFTQPLYAVADLRLGYRFGPNLEAALNVTNVTDKRYFITTGSASSGNYYGQPRAFRISVKAAY